MKSIEFLQSAMDVQKERGEQYDKPSGERSMGATVRAFNAITGRDLSEAEGWLLLQTLKDVRQWQNPDRYHHDSALDGVAYSALKAEALSEQVENLDVRIESIPSWKDAPEWAMYLAQNESGKWNWFENAPNPKDWCKAWSHGGIKMYSKLSTGKNPKWRHTLSTRPTSTTK